MFFKFVCCVEPGFDKVFFPKYVCISWPLFDFLGFAGYTFKVIVYAEFTKGVEGI